MSHIAIIGAGHAGVEAAFTLAQAGHSITLFSNEYTPPYFRPRLIAVAFGQAEISAIKIKPMDLYTKSHITLVPEAVTEWDPIARTVKGHHYDGILLAQGSKPFIPPFQGSGVARLQTLWTLEDARALRERCTAGTRLTVLGGGVLGLEAALRATLAGIKVTVVEVSPHLVGGVLGDAAEAVLRATLCAKGITLKIGTAIATIDEASVTLADGTVIPDEVVLCSTGARPQVDLAQSAGLPMAYGLTTSPTLALAPRVYAAGDLAQPTPARPPCSVRRAILMGALAAKNLHAELTGQPQTEWQDPLLPLFMKVEEVEFHTLGNVSGSDLVEERLDDGSDPTIWKSVLLKDGQPVGLRFVGTRAGFAEWEKKLS